MGLGVSAPGVLRQHGIETPDRPIAMMREYVALMRECLSGESVTFEGDFWQVKRFRLAMRTSEQTPTTFFTLAAVFLWGGGFPSGIIR